MDPLVKPIKGLEICKESFVAIVDQGLKAGCYRFVKQSAEEWLVKYPNDLLIGYYLARAFIGEKNYKNAIEIIREIVTRDPEFVQAWELLLSLTQKENSKEIDRCVGNLFLLNNAIKGFEIPQWALRLKECIDAISLGNFQTIYGVLNQILAEISQETLIGIIHLEISKLENDKETTYQLAKLYHERWSKCLQISIILAKAALEESDEPYGVSLLHECALNDPGGQVIERELGKNHEFQSIWPQDMKIVLNYSIPSQITVPLGWNQLTPGQISNDSYKSHEKQKSLLNNLHIKKLPELNLFSPKRKKASKNEGEKNDVREKEIIENPYLRVLDKSKMDDRIPVYVIMTSKNRLINKYGASSTGIIFEKIKDLNNSINLHPGWKALIFVPDDINYTRLYEVDVVDEFNPWKIKNSLTDLDIYLSTRGQMIGCLLIIGGPDIIPFHSLPNPTDDKDKGVFSDNPYSTRDANYFIPEWPVGRLVDEANNDPGLLIKQLRSALETHQSINANENLIKKYQSILFGKISIKEILKKLLKKYSNFGYSAEVWRRSSLAAFRPIGNGDQLKISPPLNEGNIDYANLMKAKWAYFNLHGLSNTSDWYGQRDGLLKTDGPDFPIALSSSQLNLCHSIPEIIFSEACYGGLINDKEIDSSIALKFIDKGVLGLIGSTCISYGSINSPLIGADLLAYIFWTYLKRGYSVGHAFIQSKIGFVKVMNQRQGYLDGEDQKTLISFTLYGDPLFLSERKRISEYEGIRQKTPMQVNSISDQDGSEEDSVRVTGAALEKLKKSLEDYIPNLDNATVKIKHHQLHFSNSGFKMNNPEMKNPFQTDRTLVTYCRQINIQKNSHIQFIRATLDHHGKMIKLAISR